MRLAAAASVIANVFTINVSSEMSINSWEAPDHFQRLRFFAVKTVPCL
jgi:hypothetical protein